MAVARSTYPPELRERAVALALEHGCAHASRVTGVNPSTIRSWVQRERQQRERALQAIREAKKRGLPDAGMLAPAYRTSREAVEQVIAHMQEEEVAAKARELLAQGVADSLLKVADELCHLATEAVAEARDILKSRSDGGNTATAIGLAPVWWTPRY